jgi:hypothetical protein
VSRGTRFTGAAPGAARRAPPRVIDVDVRPKHETLYDVLVMAPDAPTREIRRVSRALRRNLPDASELHDVCLAEQVLGRADLRAEYDGLLARLRAAGQRIPKIGAAIEGSRLPPSLAERVGSAGRAGASAAGKALWRFLQVSFLILILIGIIVAIGSSSSRYNHDKYKLPEFKPVHLPKLELPPFDPKLLEYQVRPIEIPKLELPKLDPIPVPKLPPIQIPRYQPPPYTPPVPPPAPAPEPPPAPGTVPRGD